MADKTLWLGWLRSNRGAADSFMNHLKGQIDRALWRHTAPDADHAQINGEIDALRDLHALFSSYDKEEQDNEMAVEEKRGGK